MKMTIETLYNSIRNTDPNIAIRTVRDLTLIQVSDEHFMAVAVDSDGGIGPLEHDVVKIPAYISGRFAIRVPLLEILASGASPVCAFDMLTLPMNDTGKEIIKGIRDELRAAGLGDDFTVSGSTEDNVPTSMTGIGTAIIGMVKKADMRSGTTERGDMLICAGKPKSGPEDEVRLDDPEILPQEAMRAILRTPGVHDVLPVGSHGVAYESAQMAESAGLMLRYRKDTVIDTKKSAGPSTCVLLSCTENAYKELVNSIQTPLFEIGYFDMKEKNG
ncbi:MAG: hypothetical protein R6V48_07680 [Fidelibacterota bacterium]